MTNLEKAEVLINILIKEHNINKEQAIEHMKKYFPIFMSHFNVVKDPNPPPPKPKAQVSVPPASLKTTTKKSFTARDVRHIELKD